MKKFEEMTVVELDTIMDIIITAVKEKGLCWYTSDGMCDQFEEENMPHIGDCCDEDEFKIILLDIKPSEVEYKRKFIFYLEPNDWSLGWRDCYHYVFEVFIEVKEDGTAAYPWRFNTPRTFLDECGGHVEVYFEGWHSVAAYASDYAYGG